MGQAVGCNCANSNTAERKSFVVDATTTPFAARRHSSISAMGTVRSSGIPQVAFEFIPNADDSATTTDTKSLRVSTLAGSLQRLHVNRLAAASSNRESSLCTFDRTTVTETGEVESLAAMRGTEQRSQSHLSSTHSLDASSPRAAAAENPFSWMESLASLSSGVADKREPRSDSQSW